MSNGRKLSIDEARVIIKAFEIEQTQVLKRPKEEIGIGQKLDLSLLEEFLTAIKNHPQREEIDSIRIYLGRSKRSEHQPECYDVVLVPVLTSDDDLHRVYDKDVFVPYDTIIGNTLPCPNVCPTKGAFCS